MIRVATLEDVQTISDIRVRSWQQIYRDHMAHAALLGMDPRASDERWRVMIDGTTPRSRIFVTHDGGPITGFIALEPANASHFGYEAYLSALYIEPEIIGRGQGRVLFDTGFAWMREAGYRNVFWWVIAVNWRGIAFYEKMGAKRVPGAERHCDGDRLHLLENGYALDLRDRT